jgi:predicted RND superfamily exporter protein
MRENPAFSRCADASACKPAPQWRRLTEAYRGALDVVGKVVALVGFTLAAGVGLWIGSPIKLQADMGVLLTFMLLWNMLGALLLIPALSYWLLRGVKVESL